MLNESLSFSNSSHIMNPLLREPVQLLTTPHPFVKPVERVSKIFLVHQECQSLQVVHCYMPVGIVYRYQLMKNTYGRER